MKLFRLLAAAALLIALVPAPLALAASPDMPAVGSPIHPLTFHISGANTTVKANIVKLTLPYNVRVLYATASAQAKSGDGASMVLNNDGTVMTAPILVGSVAAGVVTEATLLETQQSVAKDAAMTADLTVSSGSITDITLTIWVQRRN